MSVGKSAIIVGKRAHVGVNIDSPALGTYMIKNSISESSKYTFSSRFGLIKPLSEVPSPRAYDIPELIST